MRRSSARAGFAVLVALSGTVFAACDVRAAVLAVYSFEGNRSASSVANHVIAPDTSSVRGYSPSSFDGSFSAEWNGVQVSNDPITPDGATRVNFGLTVDPSRLLDPTMVTWRVQTESQSTGSGHATLSTLYYSVDGGSSWLGGASANVGTDPNSTSPWVQGTLDLSAVDRVGGIDFRLVLRDGSNATNKKNRVDTIIISGSVVVPEPSSVLFLLFAGAMAPCFRRRC